MKNGKVPTKRQKIAIQAAGLSSGEWLVTKNLAGKLYIQHRDTKAEKVIPA
ncbi:DUF6906 family protein [Paenibacillus koleovorans]|uniref:DUF6906 family protein n=1 Tax=Paenibacillus koleovorans TaxID=121608 RepID=UPI0035A21B89